MRDKYVWLKKEDGAYKKYQEKSWHTVLSVRTITNNVYYCYSNNKHFVTDEEKTKLLSPICVINKEYKDCMILFEDDSSDGFIWKGERCFRTGPAIINEFINSKMDFTKNNEIIKIKSASQLVTDAEIQVRSSMALLVVSIISISLVIVLFILVYLWLF